MKFNCRFIVMVLVSFLFFLCRLDYASSLKTGIVSKRDSGDILDQVKMDYKQFYTKCNLKRLAGGFLVGALLANTNIDQSVADWYQDSVRSNKTDRFSKDVKVFGNKKDVAIATASMIGVSLILHHTQLGAILGKYTSSYVRVLLVAGPVLWASQVLTGGTRPKYNQSSHWHPFRSSHGVSGHAFLGAVPFLVAARFTSRPVFKVLLYSASTFTGFSRINDNAHYLSQVLLGWWLAYVSVGTIFNDTDSHVTPFFDQRGGVGIAYTKQLP